MRIQLKSITDHQYFLCIMKTIFKLFLHETDFIFSFHTAATFIMFYFLF